MKFRTLLTAVCLPVCFAIACGGKSEEAPGAGDGDATGDGDSAGDGDAPGDGDSTPPATGDGDGDSQPADPARVEACETFCEEAVACGEQGVTECTDSCTGNTTTSITGQEALAECVDADLCEANSELALIGALACVVGEVADADLTEAQSTYCNETVALLNECTEGMPSEDPLGTCETTIGIVSDDALAPFIRCGEVSCDARQACQDAATLQLLLPLLLSGALEGEEPGPAVLGNLLTLAAIAGPLNQTEDTAVDLPIGGMGGAAGGG